MAPTKSVKAAVKYSVKALNKRPRGSDKSRRARWRIGWLEFRLKLAQNRNPLLVTLAFWFGGVAYYRTAILAIANAPCVAEAQVESPTATMAHIVLVALGIRDPLVKSDFSGLYQMTWPIFLEVIFFGFIMVTFLEQFSPQQLARSLARRVSDHAVIIGYDHLGQRIVDHLRHLDRPFVVVEDDPGRVGELLGAKEPVVVGHVTDKSVLEAASIGACREVFLLVNNLKEVVIVCHHVRSFNRHCSIYIQLFEHFEFQDYFRHEPYRASTFSTSLWAVESLDTWTDPERYPLPRSSGTDTDIRTRLDQHDTPAQDHSGLGDFVVFGRGHCAQRFARFLVTHRPAHQVYVVDDGITSDFLSIDPDQPLFQDDEWVPATRHTRSSLTGQFTQTPRTGTLAVPRLVQPSLEVPASDGAAEVATPPQTAVFMASRPCSADGSELKEEAGAQNELAASLKAGAPVSERSTSAGKSEWLLAEPVVVDGALALPGSMPDLRWMPSFRRLSRPLGKSTRRVATAVDAVRAAASAHQHKVTGADGDTLADGHAATSSGSMPPESPSLGSSRRASLSTSESAPASLPLLGPTASSAEAWAFSVAPDSLIGRDNIHLVDCFTNRLHHIEARVPLGRVSHVFMCWSDMSNAMSNAIYLTMQLQLHYPHIHVYVRTFDDEVRDVLESMGATTFSTSQYAFEMLQQKVPATSHIALLITGQAHDDDAHANADGLAPSPVLHGRLKVD